MTRYEVVFKESAVKELKALDKSVRKRVGSVIDVLASDPRPPGCVRLKGSSSYRIRVGDWRIIYEVNDGLLTVMILKTGHRSRVHD